ncbi:lamin tail domain-containing protein [Gymnodinialimonas phycosphaerae]|nr:lamin tail domain-containing protein [Gymnodinialimonas phycosphaerae]
MLLGGIVINEILVDPNGAMNFDTDGNGTADAMDEYVELYNDSSSAIDISGLELRDAGVGNWFTFPPGTILQPGAHAMVMSGVQSGGSLPTGGTDDLFFDAGRGSPLINNGGDNVILYDPTNDEYIQATFNGDAQDDPTLGAGGYSGFSATAAKVGTGEDFGNDTDGQSLQRDATERIPLSMGHPRRGPRTSVSRAARTLPCPTANEWWKSFPSVIWY